METKKTFETPTIITFERDELIVETAYTQKFSSVTIV